mgnify:CR=1 FL=1
MKTDWVENYLVKLHNGYYENNIADYIKDKANNTPNCLYKYCSPSKNSIRNFENDLIYLQHPSKFNDPFDSMLGYSKKDLYNNFFFAAMEKEDKYKKYIPLLKQYDVDFSEKANIPIIRDILFKRVNDGMDQIAEYSNEIFPKLQLKNYKVSCFSEINNSELMWAHYARSHTGYCIGYDLRYNEKIENNVDSFLLPVIYSEYRPKITDSFLDVDNILSATNSDDTIAKVVFHLLHKSKQWEYEKEWRITTIQEGNTLNVPTPKAVYLGVNIDKYDKETIVSIAKRKKIPVYQMKLSEEKYEFDKPELVK